MKLAKPINILVQRRAAIGDVIMSTAVVRELKRKYGNNAQIDIATDVAEVYRNNPHIRNIFPVDQVPSVNGRYEIYINLDDAYEINPAHSYVDNYFYRAFGNTPAMNQSVELFPTDADIAQVDNDLTELGGKFIVVHMRNWHWAMKNISMDIWLDTFTKVFEANTDFKVVCVGGPTDNFVDHPLFVDARAKYNTQQIKYLCDHAACFVGIDSGPYWCAAASSTHIIALLTHVAPKCILPYRELESDYHSSSNTAIQTLEDCAGCMERQPLPVRQITCPKQSFPCASNFDTDAIAHAILGQLNGK